MPQSNTHEAIEAEIKLDISPEAIDRATKKLAQSIRGTKALKDLYKLWDGYGHGLDSENWRALSTLCAAMNHYEQTTLVKHMRQAGGFKRPTR